ncbi:hypothetical protein GCWU000323_01175 [Leptotrichia hofstadii F0254]|uniref:Uncharacterized protein n=1 Tax=Leptotrichia hofstadii F0254 TaxID=634994 RepID=C9MXA3_9FUSO|nr:hypothetical protein GCWU000323_01175 [Leptotrichia hofstadii F0254]
MMRKFQLKKHLRQCRKSQDIFKRVQQNKVSQKRCKWKIM